MNNEKKKFVSSFLLGLIAGGLLAGAGSHFYYCHRHDKAPWGEKREMRHRKLLKEFTEKLQLNEEQ
ncbi:MAG: hypothetical protein HYS58_03405, partial [Elusimicrobia bacterium]|nr:hypothetical protein [Elusimicrobiota bacterium]